MLYYIHLGLVLSASSQLKEKEAWPRTSALSSQRPLVEFPSPLILLVFLICCHVWCPHWGGYKLWGRVLWRWRMINQSVSPGGKGSDHGFVMNIA